MSTVFRPPLITRIWPRDPNGVAVRTTRENWQNPLLTTLAHQDKFYGAAGQGPPLYDWPNPRGYVYPVSLRTWTCSLNQSTLAPAAGAPPRDKLDFANPPGRQYPNSLLTWAPPSLLQTTLKPAAQKPFKQDDWPNPRGPIPGMTIFRMYVDASKIIVPTPPPTPPAVWTQIPSATGSWSPLSPASGTWSPIVDPTLPPWTQE